MTARHNVMTLLMLGVLLVAASASAQEATDAKPEAEEETSYGINIDMGFSTIYNFRGYNSFQESSQQDSNAAYFPSVTWSMFDTGLYLGYWGAYQLTGTNGKDMVDGALGHEQDLYLGYDFSFADDKFTVSALFTYFFYPFADSSDSDNPSIIEPYLGFGYSGPVDLSIGVSYFAGITDDTEILTHLYISPSIGKSLAINDYVGMDLSFAAGFKAWKEDYDDNVVDLNFTVALPVSIPGGLYVSPSVSAAWTNIEDVDMVDDAATPEDESGKVKMTVGDEYMIYAGVNIGADF